MDFETLEALSVTRDGHVATVSLKGPGKGNAMGLDLWREMPGVFDALSADDDVRVIVLRGEGKNMTYGLDLMGVAPVMMGLLQDAASAKSRMKLHDLVLEWQESFDAIERCAKPVIAAVHGYCIGGGVNMIAACDMRVASADAVLSLREVKLAITPDLGALQRLPALIGQGMTRRLAFTGENITAQRALEIGLVDELFESQEELFAKAAELATEIANNSPLVVQGIKRVLNHSLDHQSAEGRRYVATWNAAFLPSQDLMEAFTAFMERRDPVFKGE